MKQLKHFLLLIFFTVSAVISISGTADAAVACRSLFGDSRYGHLREDFVPNTKYKVEVTEQSEIKNQCNLGTCHLYSWMSQLDQNRLAQAKSPIKISHHYLSLIHWIRESFDKLEKNEDKDDIAVQLGANVLGSRFSIFQSGIIPDQVWTGSRDFHTGALSGRISEYVQNIIGKAKWEIDQQGDEKKREQIRENAKKQIFAVFENIVGKIPTKFVYEGKVYTPQSFQRIHFPELMQPITVLGASYDRKAKTVLQYETPFFKMISTDLDSIEQTARELLDKGQNVYLGYDHNSDFVDVKTGTMSISAFNLPPGGGPLSRLQRAYFKVPPGGHAVQIVGYDVDPKTNKVARWKIKNSWGDKMGDAGYFHMYRDFFRAFVVTISYFSDADVTPEIQRVDPKQLNLEFE